MRNLLSVIVVAGLVGVVSAQAQVIRVAGMVRDDAGRPVADAAITAENPDHTPPRLTTTSNDKGQFGFIGIRRGLWTIVVNAPGFEGVQLRRQVSPGRQDLVDVRLARISAPSALPLDGIKASEIQQRIERAEALSSGGDLDGAILAWRDLLARVPALTSIHLQLGALYERKPDLARARASYQELLAVEPGNGRALAAIERLDK